MNKATYMGKSYDHFTGDTFLSYEYRGHNYTICVSHKGLWSSDLRTQHKDEQDRIDKIIAHENSLTDKPCRYEDSAEYGFNLFWNYVTGNQEEING